MLYYGITAEPKLLGQFGSRQSWIQRDHLRVESVFIDGHCSGCGLCGLSIHALVGGVCCWAGGGSGSSPVPLQRGHSMASVWSTGSPRLPVLITLAPSHILHKTAGSSPGS